MLTAVPTTFAASMDMRVGNMVFSKKVKSMTDLKYENMVRQTTDFSCGAASLATILTYYFGRETTETEILEAVLNDQDPEVVERVKREGLSLLDLKRFGERLGYGGRGFQMEPEQLRELDRPAIVLINLDGYNHFVVIKGVKGKEVHIADPAKGHLVKSLKEFKGMWNGILLAFVNNNGQPVQSHGLVVKNGIMLHRDRIVPTMFNMDLVRNPSEF